MGIEKVDPGHALKTYRYLRMGIVGTVLLLGVSIGWEFREVAWGCMQTSISAYYYTPVRAIFVGALMAIGLALIVIKGRPVQDVALNIAGMFAPVVAIIPTSGMGKCWSRTPDPEPLNKTTKDLEPWVVDNIENNFYALVIAGIAGLVIACWLAYRDRSKQPPTGELEKNMRQLEESMRTSAVITGAILLLSLLLKMNYGGFTDNAHNWFAGLMFVALNIAMVAEAIEARKRSSKYSGWYWFLSGLMALAGPAVWGIAAAKGVNHHILIIEAWEITVFAVFWVVQTADNWHLDLAVAGEASGPPGGSAASAGAGR